MKVKQVSFNCPRRSARDEMPPTTLCYFGDLPPSSKAHGLDMSPWMDAAPLTVVDHTTVNIVYDLFKKMGLRVVLVIAAGRLVGIITKKDVLRHLPRKHK